MRETILKGISANLPEQLQQSEQMLDEVKAVEDRSVFFYFFSRSHPQL